VVAAVISDLEHAVGDGGALNPVVPARRRLLGGLNEDCTVVSRGPRMLQRGLTAMVMAAPARIVMGQVDRRIDDDDDAFSGQHHRPVVGGEVVGREVASSVLLLQGRTFRRRARRRRPTVSDMMTDYVATRPPCSGRSR
jgi:hypothetical protein